MTAAPAGDSSLEDVALARPARRGLKIARNVLIGIALLAFVVVLWHQGQKLINGQTEGWASYVLVALLVFGDAVFPVLPGETTLSAASVLAASGILKIWIVILAGAIGAVTGDSTVYWVARRATGRTRIWMDKATDNKSATKVLDLLDRRGAAFLLFGRYIPGVRFALNAVLGGIVRMPYPRFLRWSALSGTIWSAFTCVSAYFISTALSGYPLLSLIVAGIVSSVLIGLFITAQNRIQDRQRRRAAVRAEAAASPEAADGDEDASQAPDCATAASAPAKPDSTRTDITPTDSTPTNSARTDGGTL